MLSLKNELLLCDFSAVVESDLSDSDFRDTLLGRTFTRGSEVGRLMYPCHDMRCSIRFFTYMHISYPILSC